MFTLRAQHLLRFVIHAQKKSICDGSSLAASAATLGARVWAHLGGQDDLLGRWCALRRGEEGRGRVLEIPCRRFLVEEERFVMDDGGGRFGIAVGICFGVY